jgi:hypothetical protein
MSLMNAKWLNKDSQSLEDNSGALRVKVDAAGSLERTADGLNIKLLGVADGQLAGSISFSKLADSAYIARLDQAETITGAWTFNTVAPQSSVTPTSANDLVNKVYADSIAAGLDPKASVRVATTADLASWTPSGSGVGKTLTAPAVGLTTIDTIDLNTVTMRVLVKNGVDGSNVHNGIYTVTTVGNGGTATVLTRATDFDGSPSSEVSGGNFTFVEAGTAGAGKGFTVLAAGDIVVDTNPIVFTQFSQAAAYTEGNGIDITSNVVSVVADTTGGANLATAISVTVNGVAVKVDDASIEGDAGNGGRLRIKADGVGANELDLSETYDFATASGTVKVGTPLTATEAANKDYVDSAVAGLTGTIVDQFTLGSTEISNKYVSLSAVPSDAMDVILLVKGAPAQFYGDDYIMDGVITDRLKWTSLGLDGVLASGDKLTVLYSGTVTGSSSSSSSSSSSAGA